MTEESVKAGTTLARKEQGKAGMEAEACAWEALKNQDEDLGYWVLFWPFFVLFFN